MTDRHAMRRAVQSFGGTWNPGIRAWVIAGDLPHDFVVLGDIRAAYENIEKYVLHHWFWSPSCS